MASWVETTGRSVFSAFSSTPIDQSTPPNLPWCNFGKSAPFPDFCHDKTVLQQCSHGFVSRMTVDVRNLKRLTDVSGSDDSCFVTHSELSNTCPAQSFGKTCHGEWLALMPQHPKTRLFSVALLLVMQRETVEKCIFECILHFLIS
jgi:hypothetical protein